MTKYMKLFFGQNKLLDKVKYCDNIFFKIKGLMFSKKLPKKNGLLLALNKESKDLASIHMLFVFFVIDVYWLNKDFRVVDIRKNVKPFEIMVRPKFKAKYILETNKGTIKEDILGKKLRFN